MRLRGSDGVVSADEFAPDPEGTLEELLATKTTGTPCRIVTSRPEDEAALAGSPTTNPAYFTSSPEDHS